MDENIKKGIKRFARDAEVGFARSVLRWKYKKEGRPAPSDSDLEERSRQVAVQAHDIVARRGSSVLSGLKQVYRKAGINEKEDPNE